MQFRKIAGRGAAAVAAVALASGAFTAPAVAAGSSLPTLHITAGKKSMTVAGPTRLVAGRFAVTFTAKDTERAVQFAKFKRGYSYKQFKADVRTFGASQGPNGPSKAGLAALNRAINRTVLLGGFDAVPGQTVRGTVLLPKAGTYFAWDDTNQNPSHPHKLVVQGPAASRPAPAVTARVTTKNGFRFSGQKSFAHKGVLRFRDLATDSPHILVLIHVKTGTTRKEILDYFASGSQAPPAFARQGGLTLDAVSPGREVTVNYRLPRGDYAELCFFPDRETGMPHAFMGMVRIVHLT